MTEGMWKCVKCRYEAFTSISTFLEKCPECGAEYELVEFLKGAHPVSEIPIFTLKGENLELTVLPGVFAYGPNKQNLERFFRAAKNVDRALVEDAKEVSVGEILRTTLEEEG